MVKKIQFSDFVLTLCPFLCIPFLLIGSAVASSSVTAISLVQKVPGGFELVVPKKVIDKLCDSSAVFSDLATKPRHPKPFCQVPKRPLRLELIDPTLGNTSVTGSLRRTAKNRLKIRTNKRLDYLPQSGTSIQLVDPNTEFPGDPCFEAEFGSSCRLAWCVGTVYCLPGPGPGGFVCSCV